MYSALLHGESKVLSPINLALVTAFCLPTALAFVLRHYNFRHWPLLIPIVNTWYIIGLFFKMADHVLDEERRREQEKKKSSRDS